MEDIRALTYYELEKVILENGEKKFRAKQVYEWLWKKSVGSIEEMTNLPKTLREKLKKSYAVYSVSVADYKKSKDRTIKLLFRLYDGVIVEGVLIPSGKRVTACISTQAGCKLKCEFCATGRMKFQRNLASGEVYDQVVLMNRHAEDNYGHGLSNIVLMGMGEPLLNYENVVSAIDKLSGRDGLGISPRRITLSTAGIIEGIKRLADEGLKINLAISLHTADPVKRDKLMPVNRTNTLDELAKSIIYFHKKTGLRVTYEYLLLKDVNDDLEDAQKLAAFCKISPCKINLIEYNTDEEIPFERSEKEKTEKFKDILEAKNMIVNIRRSRGGDVHAACGQLANRE